MKKAVVVCMLSFVIVLVGCASIPPAPVPEVEPMNEVVTTPVSESVALGLATVYAPARYVPVRPAVPYGNALVVSNHTGYLLNRFDVFNDQMYLLSDTQIDLFEGKGVEDGKYRTISLDTYSHLKEQLFRKDGSVFYLNATDSDGDLYFKEWNPEVDSWNLEMTFDDLVYEDLSPMVESFGEYLLIGNFTGFPLTQLYLQLTPYGEGEPTTNVLGDMVLIPGETVRLEVSDLPWLNDVMQFNDYGHVYVTAIDGNDTHFTVDWYPTTDLWFIDLYSDLVLGNPDAVWLRVVNDTPWIFWTLYAMTDEMNEAGEYGEDLLGDNILADGEEISVDISSVLPTEGLIHLVAFDNDDIPYYQVLDPNADTLEVVFVDEGKLEEVIPVSLP